MDGDMKQAESARGRYTSYIASSVNYVPLTKVNAALYFPYELPRPRSRQDPEAKRSDNPFPALGNTYCIMAPASTAHIVPRMESKSKPPFLRLPLNIRRPIYEQVLVSQAPIEIHPKARRGSVKSRSSEPTPPIRGRPALLQVCEQIRQEATPIHYSQNTFVIPWGFPNLGCRWLDSLTIPQRQALRDVRFCYGDGAFWTIYDARIALTSLHTGLAKSGSLLDLTEARLWVPVCEFSVHTWTELAKRKDAQWVSMEETEPFLDISGKSLRL